MITIPTYSCALDCEHNTEKSKDCVFETISYRWNPKEIKLIVSETVENNENYSINATLFLPIPKNTSHQQIHFPISYNIPPDVYYKDSWGQRIASYQREISPGDNVSIQWMINATIYTTRFVLFPWLVHGEIPKEIIETYTKDEEKYNINHPLIKKIVKEETGSISNPLIKAIVLCNYVKNQLSYVLDDRWDDAPTVLTRGNGSCSEYCFVYISLLRSAGIPAHYVGGTVFKSDKAPYIDTVFHRIVELYLPNYGWVPVDPTWSKYCKIPFYYFGMIQNKFFIFNIAGGSSEYLDWNYCHWENWIPHSENVEVNLSMIWKQWQ